MKILNLYAGRYDLIIIISDGQMRSYFRKGKCSKPQCVLNELANAIVLAFLMKSWKQFFSFLLDVSTHGNQVDVTVQYKKTFL